ncbi:MAG: helix-hairpin-helix domain-containing protein [Gammaproteobacteria bacterium]|nr:helix-hairpin-helix domain-containing protein [Gammaproteobacteria bacterium]
MDTANPLTINHQVAQTLREMAGLLEEQDANPFRINAYRRAAETVDGLGEDIDLLYRRVGREGLQALPFIGQGIATAVESLLQTGHFPQMERLRGHVDPEALFDSIPGIGPKLAAIIHDTLHVDTLAELEVAAHDGRLESVPGIGAGRAETIRAVLAEKLKRPTAQRRERAPDVATILEADAEYRRKAEGGELRTIAPRRFNPSHQAWLPVLHTDKDGWHMTLLFSNTARAHELGRTRDWVVVYFYDADHNEGQCTVVTETMGPKKGKRVVRGRETEIS